MSGFAPLIVIRGTDDPASWYAATAPASLTDGELAAAYQTISAPLVSSPLPLPGNFADDLASYFAATSTAGSLTDGELWTGAQSGGAPVVVQPLPYLGSIVVEPPLELSAGLAGVQVSAPELLPRPYPFDGSVAVDVASFVEAITPASFDPSLLAPVLNLPPLVLPWRPLGDVDHFPFGVTLAVNSSPSITALEATYDVVTALDATYDVVTALEATY